MDKVTIFKKVGDSIVVQPSFLSTPADLVPPEPGIYYPSYDELRGIMSLKHHSAAFTMPSVIYGDHTEVRDSIAGDVYTTPGSTGVLLYGKQGTGKSTMADDLCNIGISMYNALVIYIPVDIKPNPSFIRELLNAIPGRKIVYMDEFSKNYNAERGEQDKWLNLFCDGECGDTTFIVVDNDKSSFCKYLLDRPGRFRYRLQYKALQPDEVTELVYSSGLKGDIAKEIIDYGTIQELTYDTLLTVISVAKTCENVNVLYAKVAKYNLPPIPGFLPAILTFHPKTGHKPNVSYILESHTHCTKITGTMSLNEGEPFSVSVDLTTLVPRDGIYEEQRCDAYRFDIGNGYVFEILRVRYKCNNNPNGGNGRDDITINDTAGSRKYITRHPSGYRNGYSGPGENNSSELNALIFDKPVTNASYVGEHKEVAVKEAKVAEKPATKAKAKAEPKKTAAPKKSSSLH